nr:MAG TPA: hypothetical protein [Caudoviricetes sp.]
MNSLLSTKIILRLYYISITKMLQYEYFFMYYIIFLL